MIATRPSLPADKPWIKREDCSGNCPPKLFRVLVPVVIAKDDQAQQISGSCKTSTTDRRHQTPPTTDTGSWNDSNEVSQKTSTYTKSSSSRQDMDLRDSISRRRSLSRPSRHSRRSKSRSSTSSSSSKVRRVSRQKCESNKSTGSSHESGRRISTSRSTGVSKARTSRYSSSRSRSESRNLRRRTSVSRRPSKDRMSSRNMNSRRGRSDSRSRRRSKSKSRIHSESMSSSKNSNSRHGRYTAPKRSRSRSPSPKGRRDRRGKSSHGSREFMVSTGTTSTGLIIRPPRRQMSHQLKQESSSCSTKSNRCSSRSRSIKGLSSLSSFGRLSRSVSESSTSSLKDDLSSGQEGSIKEEFGVATREIKQRIFRTITQSPSKTRFNIRKTIVNDIAAEGLNLGKTRDEPGLRGISKRKSRWRNRRKDALGLYPRGDITEGIYPEDLSPNTVEPSTVKSTRLLEMIAKVFSLLDSKAGSKFKDLATESEEEEVEYIILDEEADSTPKPLEEETSTVKSLLMTEDQTPEDPDAGSVQMVALMDKHKAVRDSETTHSDISKAPIPSILGILQDTRALRNNYLKLLSVVEEDLEGKGSIETLERMCEAMGWSQPQYCCQGIDSQLCQCQVIVNEKMYGPYSYKEELAARSEAALNCIQSIKAETRGQLKRLNQV